MFAINIYILGQGKFGIEALDWRRTRGLPDGSRLKVDTCNVHVEVDEQFARDHFGKTEIESTIHINLDRLQKGDVSISPIHPDFLEIHLTPERAKQIYVDWHHKPTPEEITRQA